MDANLSSITKRTYLERLKFFIESTKKDLKDIILHPEESIEWIEKHSTSLQTQKSYLSAILAVFKHTPSLKETEKDIYYKWYLAFKKVHDQIDSKYKMNEPSLKQKEGYVPYKDIVEKRDELKKGSKERLLLAMYTYLRPLRSDFNKVYIYEKPQKIYSYDNYIVLTETPELVLREFKTAKKKLENIYQKELPKNLIEEIQQSLEKHPREWLFVDRTGEPYKSDSFTKWVNRTLKSLFGKPLTISLIRHSYINHLDFNKLTIQEKEEIAKDMAHTADTQDRYRLIFN